LTAKLDGLEKVTLWQEYSARLHAELEECDLAYFKFKQHVSEHGCYGAAIVQITDNGKTH